MISVGVRMGIPSSEWLGEGGGVGEDDGEGKDECEDEGGVDGEGEFDQTQNIHAHTYTHTHTHTLYAASPHAVAMPQSTVREEMIMVTKVRVEIQFFLSISSFMDFIIVSNHIMSERKHIKGKHCYNCKNSFVIRNGRS